MSTHPVNCPEVIGKTVKSLKLYSTTGILEEIAIEFTDGTSFTASCESRLTAKASLIRTGSGAPETLAAYMRRTDEGTLSRLLVQAGILLAAARSNPASVLKDAASTYKVDTATITAKVRQEFAAKAKAKKVPKPPEKVRRAA